MLDKKYERSLRISPEKWDFVKNILIRDGTLIGSKQLERYIYKKSKNKYFFRLSNEISISNGIISQYLFLNYKLDQADIELGETKFEQEYNLKLEPHEIDTAESIIALLGFKKVGYYCKKRSSYVLGTAFIDIDVYDNNEIIIEIEDLNEKNIIGIIKKFDLKTE